MQCEGVTSGYQTLPEYDRDVSRCCVAGPFIDLDLTIREQGFTVSYSSDRRVKSNLRTPKALQCRISRERKAGAMANCDWREA